MTSIVIDSYDTRYFQFFRHVVYCWSSWKHFSDLQHVWTFESDLGRALPPECAPAKTINWNAVWPVGQYQNFNKQLCVKYCWQCFLFCGHPIDQSCTWSTSCMTCASNSSPSSMALRNSKNKHASTCIGNWCSRSIVNTEHAIHHPSTKSQSSPMIQAGFQCL